MLRYNTYVKREAAMAQMQVSSARAQFPASLQPPFAKHRLHIEHTPPNLDTLFAGFWVNGTRRFLLSSTTCLARIGSAANAYFSRLSTILAFERTMRGFAQLAAAFVPVPWNYAQPLYWSGLAPATTHSAFPAVVHAANYKAAAGWTPHNSFWRQPAQPNGQTLQWPDLTPLLILPAAMIAAMPALDSWMRFAITA